MSTQQQRSAPTAAAQAQTLHHNKPANPTEASGSVLDAAIQETKVRAKTVGSAADFLGVPAKQLYPLLRNVWKTGKDSKTGRENPELTDQEIYAGLHMIGRYELDPFAREIYVTRDNRGKLMVVIGIDGIVKILDRTEGYDGFEQTLNFAEEGNVKTPLVSVETRIYTTKRNRPTVYLALAREYDALGGFMKGKIPDHMLRLFSLRHATRLFTPLGAAVVTPEEAEWRMNAPAEIPEPSAASKAAEKRLQEMEAAQRGDETTEAGSEPTTQVTPTQQTEDLPMDMPTGFKQCRTVAEVRALYQRYVEDGRDMEGIGDIAEERCEQIEASAEVPTTPPASGKKSK